MLLLNKYPDLMIKDEVAEVLRCKPVSVPRLKGLVKTFVVNGRKHFLYRKQDVVVGEQGAKPCINLVAVQGFACLTANPAKNKHCDFQKP